MRVAITGATGNVGTRLVERLLAERLPSGDVVEEIVAISSRLPEDEVGLSPRVTRRRIDLGTTGSAAELRTAFAGVDAVVHLAFLLQPSRDPALMAAVNVDGTGRVFDAVGATGVDTLVHTSSLGAYSEGPQDRAVDETWPTGGLHTSTYSRHKAICERLLDVFEDTHPAVRVARVRPALVLQAGAGAEQGRYFLGRLLPRLVPRPGSVPILPAPPRLRLQVVHTADLADAFARILFDPTARGAYNVAADPVLDPPALAHAVGARWVSVPASLLRGLVDVSWRLGLQPTDPGWVDLGMLVPTLDTTRIRSLGWVPSRGAEGVVREALQGVADGAGGSTPPLRPR